MKFTCSNLAILLSATSCLSSSTTSAFAPNNHQQSFLKIRRRGATSSDVLFSSISSDDSGTRKPLFDPFGLYPKNAPERQEGRIQPIEDAIPNADKTRKDPLQIYADETELDDKPMSKSLPFLQRPALLDGETIPGDFGFDPFNFSSTPESLQWYRTAEVKHARLAMLAAVGWPLAELFDKPLAQTFGLKPLLVFRDQVPSVLNGGLDRTPAAFWVSLLGLTVAIEFFGIMRERSAMSQDKQMTPGDLGFDPLGLAANVNDRKYLADAELFQGRLAMLAITSFVFQEWWYDNAIVNQFPIFFKPFWVAIEQLQDQAGEML